MSTKKELVVSIIFTFFFFVNEILLNTMIVMTIAFIYFKKLLGILGIRYGIPFSHMFDRSYYEFN